MTNSFICCESPCARHTSESPRIRRAIHFAIRNAGKHKRTKTKKTKNKKAKNSAAITQAYYTNSYLIYSKGHFRLVRCGAHSLTGTNERSRVARLNGRALPHAEHTHTRAHPFRLQSHSHYHHTMIVAVEATNETEY